MNDKWQVKELYSVRKKLKSGRESLVQNCDSLDDAKLCCDKNNGSYVLKLIEELVYSIKD